MGLGPTMTGPMISKMFKGKPPFRDARTDGAVQRERERAAAVRRPGVFPEGKTLMPGGFTSPVQIKKRGPRRPRQRTMGLGPTMTGPMISKMFKGKPPFRDARTDGAVQRERERAAAVRIHSARVDEKTGAHDVENVQGKADLHREETWARFSNSHYNHRAHLPSPEGTPGLLYFRC